MLRRNSLTELRAISTNNERVETHVLFVHGLSGHIEKTWTSNTSNSPMLWPLWLDVDVRNIRLWLVGYPAAKSNWSGYGFPIVDRADNILARLLTEPDLTRGNIIFVAHSLGGLVVEQILRNADREANMDQRAKEFLARVRRVAFLGTPHRGAFLANLIEALWPLSRSSEATRDLILSRPQLRDLNYWYRQYSLNNRIENLILAEGRPERMFGIPLPNAIGRVVSVDSADAGLSVTPIIVDESHTSISKPANREAEVYDHVRDFVSRRIGTALKVTRTDEMLERTASAIQGLTTRTEEQSAAFTKLRNTIIKDTSGLGFHTAIIDAEVERRLERIRKCRFFGEFDAIEEIRSLVASVEGADLALASEEQKGTALAWCARLLSGDDPDEAVSILDRITTVNTEVSDVAKSVVKASRDDLQQGICELCAIGTPVAYGAAYISMVRAKGVNKANEWLQKAGLKLADLDSDAKFFYIRKALEEGSWENAFDAAETLVDEEFERSPGLIVAAADAFLMLSVPGELRESFLAHELPFDAVEFPLRSEPLALEHRRTAMQLYERLHSVAKGLGLPGIARLMDDKALWLRLMDPESEALARRELEESLMDPSKFLRRLGLGLQFGIDIDLEWAEKEVDRQTALSGGLSLDAAVARFALALSKESHATAAYINEHREQLLKHLNWKGVYFIEIEMLANAGQMAKAEERLKEATERGLTEREIAWLVRDLAEATDGDPIAQRLAAYEESGSIVDLRMLVSAYENAHDWQKTCEYGKTLLDVSGDLSDAGRYVISLYHIERHDELLKIFETYPALLDRHDDLRLLRIQSRFESGRLLEALADLKLFRQANDSPDARQLQINLGVVSGDWESLQGFVEDEWNAQEDRTAIDLLRAGQIAQHIGASRGKNLVQEAANRASDDPAVLVGCYEAATAAGWEDNIEVNQWLEKAAQLSGDSGPVQVMAIEDILERKSNWESRESNAWELLEKGDIPVFAAGRLLNRSLLSLYLMPALNNLDEIDVRKRSMIYAFSGAREKHKFIPKVVAMDATALITAEFLDLFDVYIETFENIVIPHSTLGWLLEEKARILFHQPSRVDAARELRQMISDGHLHMFEGGNDPPDKLVNEVGTSMAALIAVASSLEHADSRQRLVVRGGPVHKTNSFMREEADLSEYETYICSSISVVEKLASKGILTSREVEKAYSALKVRELRWSSEPQITDGAVLYLDDLAVSHLKFLGLLSKLHRADFTAFVSRSKVEEADALISYDLKANEVVSIVDQLRFRLREGLETGKIRLGTMIRGEDNGDPGNVTSHPTIDLLKLVSNADVGVVDDRFINQHQSISLESTGRPLLTTIDLLDILVELGAIEEDRKHDALTRLRQANFALTPLTAADLNRLISLSIVSDGALEETAELRSIREGIQRVRMSNMLQSAKELAWLSGVTQACLFTLQEQWRDGFDEATAVARSDWLLALSDVRGWTHRLDENVDQLTVRYRNWVLVLMRLAAEQPQSAKEAYWRWFDSRILELLQEEEPNTYQYLVKWAEEYVAGSVSACELDLEGDDE